MRMKRGTYQIEKEKHKKLMSRLIADNMSFNEFLDRISFLYLKGEYEIDMVDDTQK